MDIRKFENFDNNDDKISVTWEVTYKNGIEDVPLEELNIENKQEWDSLSEDEQRNLLQEYLSDAPIFFGISPKKWEND